MQEKACRSWAKANGHKIVATFTDAGISGSKDISDRPGLSAAIDTLRPPPRATGLIVAKLDRLARALHVQESVLQVVWRAGGSVFTADTGEVLQDDPDDPMRTFVCQVVGGVAQLERSLIAERMRDGRNAKRETRENTQSEATPTASKAQARAGIVTPQRTQPSRSQFPALLSYAKQVTVTERSPENWTQRGYVHVEQSTGRRWQFGTSWSESWANDRRIVGKAFPAEHDGG